MDIITMDLNEMTRRDFLRLIGLGTSVMAVPGYMSALTIKTQNGKSENPNIILFLTDDQGWTDTSVQMMEGRSDSKSDFYQTPALERMAKESMTFSSGYAPAPVCGPTLERHTRHWVQSISHRV